MKAKGDDNQLILPFTGQLNEALSKIVMMAEAIPDLGPMKVNGVVELLQRIVIFSRDRTQTRASVTELASGPDSRRTVSTRTIERWSKLAIRLGVLNVDWLSQMYGGHQTNRWSVNWERIDELIEARRRPDTGPTRARQCVGPGPDNVSGPRKEFTKENPPPPYPQNENEGEAAAGFLADATATESASGPMPPSALVRSAPSRQQNRPVEWTASAQSRVMDALAAVKVAYREGCIAHAKRRGMTSDDLLGLIAKAQANRHLFTKSLAGAIYCWVRDGVPPASGVRDVEQIEHNAFRGEAKCTADRLVGRWRREEVDEAEIRRRLENVKHPVSGQPIPPDLIAEAMR